jgi:hypothetical protein
MATYFQLKNDLTQLKDRQETETRINNIRLKIIESQVAVLQQELHEIRPHHIETLSVNK